MKSLHCLTTQVEGQKGADLFRLYLVTMKILLLVVASHCTVFFPPSSPFPPEKNFIRSNPKVITYSSAIFQQTRQNYSKSKKQIILLYICLWRDEPGQIRSGRYRDGMVANKYAVLPNIKLSPDVLL